MSGNGVDIGAVYGLLATVAADVRGLRQEIAKKADRDDVVNLRRALTDYHSAVLGHGILITELDMRLRRVEQHLDLPSVA